MKPPPERPAPPLRAVRITARCPICSKSADQKYQPFCSKRCADIDLGRWLKEGYRVPTDEPLSEEEISTLRRSTGQDR